MRRKFAIVVVLFCVTQVALAHRIDEFLQATMLSLQADRLQASMRLIPGVLVAPAVIGAIDTNGDGAFSAEEQETYARRVLQDLSVTLDGKPLELRLVSWSVPPPAQLRDGLGEIHVAYVVDLPAGGRERRLILENHHLNVGSVYLVNVVVPDDQGLRITGQRRNAQQSRYELEYEQADAAGSGERCRSFAFG